MSLMLRSRQDYGKAIDEIVEDWEENQLQPNFNPTSTLVKLINVIHKLVYNFIGYSKRPSINKSQMFLYVMQKLINQRDFINKINNVYKTGEFSASLQLNPNDTSKLQSSSRYLNIVYMIYIHDTKSVSDDDLHLFTEISTLVKFSDEYVFYYFLILVMKVTYPTTNYEGLFTDNDINEFIMSAFRKMCYLLNIDGDEENENRDEFSRYFYHEDLQMIKVNNSHQRHCITFLFTFTDLNQRNIIGDVIPLNMAVTAFLILLDNISSDSDNYSMINDGLDYFLLLLKRSDFCVAFTNASGYQKLVRIQSIPTIHEKVISCCFSLITTDPSLMTIYRARMEIIIEFLSIALTMVQQSDLHFGADIFIQGYRIPELLWEFILRQGILSFRNIIDDILDLKITCELDMTEMPWNLMEKWSIILEKYVASKLNYNMNFTGLNLPLLKQDEIEEFRGQMMFIDNMECSDIAITTHNDHDIETTHLMKMYYDHIHKIFEAAKNTDYFNNLDFRKWDTLINITVTISLDVRTIFTINNYQISTWSTSLIEYLCKRLETPSTSFLALMFFKNCFWHLINKFYADYVTNMITPDTLKYKNYFTHFLHLIKCNINIYLFLNGLHEPTHKLNWKTYLSILTALAFDNHLRKVIISYGADNYDLEILKQLFPENEYMQNLPIYALVREFIQCISEQKELSNTKTVNKLTNVVTGLANREMGMNDRNCYNKLIHNNCKESQIITVMYDSEDFDNAESITDINHFRVCEYSPHGHNIYVGTHAGTIIVYDLNTCAEKMNKNFSNWPITHLQIDKWNNLMIANIDTTDDISTLLLDPKTLMTLPIAIAECSYAEFNKLQDKIIGTNKRQVHIYDITTQRELKVLHLSNPCTNGDIKASFNMFDDLALSNRTLWDLRTYKEIWKFPKLNIACNGLFHPNGTHLIIDEYIWDLRNYHMIKYVSALHNNTSIVSSPFNNNILYAIIERDVLKGKSHNSVNIINLNNYSAIETILAKCEETDFYALACHPYVEEFTVIQNLWDQESVRSEAQVYKSYILD